VTVYTQMIRESMACAGHICAADRRQIEGWMRLEHGCLDSVSRARFTEEVIIALQCVAAGPTADSEALATSFGL
jgi:hypothetical protein